MKDYHHETGRKRKFWKFYNAIDNILSTELATQPTVVIDTFKKIPVSLCRQMSYNLSKNVENDVEEMIEKELEYVKDKETGEVNEKSQGRIPELMRLRYDVVKRKLR